ncbi:TetR/AcrR family transcriptional regulator [Xylanibacter muris]|nr:TetR/AcrR family transcriptional regulator [Xylanibacter muris]
MNIQTTYRQSLKEEILVTAMELFINMGIKAVKMDDIANKLGISKRTLYETCDNKEELLFECAKMYKKKREIKTKELIKECNSAMDILLRMYKQKIEECKVVNPQFYLDIVKYPKITAFFEEDAAEKKRHFLKFLNRGINEGYFRADVNYNLLVNSHEILSKSIVMENLYKKYTMEELFFNLIFVSFRGFCTKKGIEEMDFYLEMNTNTNNTDTPRHP